MKVIAINASPVMDKGSTAAILTPFLDGMGEAGTEIELFYTKQLDIKPCQGEFKCRIEGKCFQVVPSLSAVVGSFGVSEQ
jgi:multimeric flavodoxin WrbA